MEQNFSTFFTIDELKKSGSIIRNNFYMIPVAESELKTDEERL
jgi:hypothetical protein